MGEAARICWACRQEASDGVDLKTCTECKVARYCNRECQRKEWRVCKLLHRKLVHLHSLLQGVGDNQGIVGQECQRGGGGGRLKSDIGWRKLRTFLQRRTVKDLKYLIYFPTIPNNINVNVNINVTDIKCNTLSSTFIV